MTLSQEDIDALRALCEAGNRWDDEFDRLAWASVPALIRILDHLTHIDTKPGDGEGE